MRVVRTVNGTVSVGGSVGSPPPVGVPTIGVYGSTSPGFTPPLGADAQVVEIDLDCRPCFQRTCPLGHTDCLKKLEPAEVIRRLPVGLAK